MRHVVVGTAGHVDHGKTPLVHALTDVQTDRLPEEQRRGITIELGFAPWKIDEGTIVSIIDAPGHRRLVHTMIAGASGIDIVLLVVAADEGVMPQTREHIAACRLLGVKRAVIAVTKVDRVDEELAELAGEEARELLDAEGIASEVVPCSAKARSGLAELRAAVLQAIQQTETRVLGRHLRLAVDRVFSVHGSGTVVTGTLIDGLVRVGQSLRVLDPATEHATSARGLHVHGETTNEVQAPTRLAINLSALTTEQVHRGSIITDDPHVTPTGVVDVWLDTPEPPKRGVDASMFVGTSRSVAKIQPLENAEENGGTLARLRLAPPLVVFGGDRFVLRGAQVDGPAGAVIGGGVVLDAHPPRRGRASKRAPLLRALRANDATAALLALVDEQAPRSLARHVFPSRFSIGGHALEQAADRGVEGEQLEAVSAGHLMTPKAFEQLKLKACALVEGHHEAAPLDPGMRLQTLREQLASIAGPEASEAAVARLSDTSSSDSALLLEEDTVRTRGFRGVAGDPKAAAALASTKKLFSTAALAGMRENAVITEVDCDSKMARALLAFLVRDGNIVKSGDLWFDASAVKALQAKVVAHLDANGELNVRDFKELTGLGRKQAIPLLEHFDREKVTRRQGDVRVRGSR